MTRRIISLTHGYVPLFAWRLPREIAAYKQEKLQAQQWINVIRGLTQKGVKAREIEDSGVIAWLTEQDKKQVTKEEVAEFASFSLPSIKECRLSGREVTYKSYSYAEHAPLQNYFESLFYFPTVVEDLGDRIAELDESISALNFDFEKLAEDPDLVFRLDDKRQELLNRQKNPESDQPAISTHFSSRLKEICPDARADFAHMRWSLMEEDGKKILFVHEFQSDWAQRGRQSNWTGHYKTAPLVTDTESWTTFLIRRAMSIAIEEGCEELTWINGPEMSNGGRIPGPEGLREFYQRIVPSCAKKASKGMEAELYLRPAKVIKREDKQLAFMPVTSKMREEFSPRIPVYSYATVVAKSTYDHSLAERLERSLQIRTKSVLGEDDLLKVRIAREVLQAHDSRRPAGALIGKVAHIAFNAKDPIAALDHEAFHFAMVYQFRSKEKEEVIAAFVPGSPLLVRTIQLLTERKEFQAVVQASKDPEEAAAHAYGLWRIGKMNFEIFEGSSRSKKIASAISNVIAKYFPAAERALNRIFDWIKGEGVSAQDFVAKVVRRADRGFVPEQHASNTYSDDGLRLERVTGV